MIYEISCPTKGILISRHEEVAMQIAKRIHKLCAESGLSLRQLEEEAGLGARGLERMLAGQEVLSCEILGRLAAALEVPLVRLFCDEGEVVPTPKLTPRLTLQQLAEDWSGQRDCGGNRHVPPVRSNQDA